jgi:hypothetical protein
MSFKQTTQKTKTKTSKFQPIALDTKEEKRRKQGSQILKVLKKK